MDPMNQGAMTPEEAEALRALTERVARLERKVDGAIVSFGAAVAETYEPHMRPLVLHRVRDMLNHGEKPALADLLERTEQLSAALVVEERKALTASSVSVPCGVEAAAVRAHR